MGTKKEHGDSFKSYQPCSNSFHNLRGLFVPATTLQARYALRSVRRLDHVTGKWEIVAHGALPPSIYLSTQKTLFNCERPKRAAYFTSNL